MHRLATVSNTRLRLIGAFTIFIATFISYWPAMRGDFIWDDDRHVSDNPTLRDARGLARIWLEWGATPQYYPLTHTSFWIEHRFWGLQSTGYHLTNVLLHVANALLLWRLLGRLGVPAAWLAAAIFALHPINVESVAWISERKNVLSMCLALVSILFYLDQSPHGYVLSLLLFLGAMLSKTFVATTPAVILVLMWWKTGRIAKRDVLKLLPMFAIAIGMGLMTAVMETSYVGARGADWDLSLGQRVIIAGRAVWFYLSKLVWPVNLTFSYPRWDIDSRKSWQWAHPILVIVVVVAAALSRKRLGRGAIAAILVFVGTLFPALGFFNTYPMRYSFVADHFGYLSAPAMIAMVVVWVSTFGRSMLPGVGAILLVLLGVLTWKQSHVYTDVETVWRDTIRKNPSSWMARQNLAVTLSALADRDRARRDEGSARAKLDEALRLLDEVEQLRPQHDKVRTTRADVLLKLGHVDRAMEIYRSATSDQPDDIRLRIRFAEVLESAGSVDQAIEQLREALSRRDEPPVLLELGLMLARHHRTAEARPIFERYVSRRPGDVGARVALGFVYEELGERELALSQFKQALEIEPDHAQALAGLDLLRRKEDGR